MHRRINRRKRDIRCTGGEIEEREILQNTLVIMLHLGECIENRCRSGLWYWIGHLHCVLIGYCLK